MTAPGHRSPDRRQRKTHAALQQALLELVAATPYDKITVEDIAETADVARATFYAHYENKGALLAEATAALTAGLREEVVAAGTGEVPVYRGLALAAFLRYAEAHRALFELIVSGGAGPGVRAELLGALEEMTRTVLATWAKEPPLPLDFVVSAFVGAVTRATELWLADTRRRPAEELAAALMQAQVGGLEWAIGLEPGEMRFEPATPGGR